MKKCRPFINLLLIAGVLFTVVTACNKMVEQNYIDDPDGDSPITGTMKDADGNNYNTLKIGTQVWTVENLKTTKYNDGTPIPNVTDNNTWTKLKTGAYSNYDNLESNATIYGRLYNWYAVNTGKLAPTGWHVPTNEDWIILENYVVANLGTSGSVTKALASKTNWAVSSEIKAIGNDLTINNSSGFTALPGGSRYDSDGDFYNIGINGVWWCSTEYSGSDAYLRTMNNRDYTLIRDYYYKENGFSVRLVRD